ncbi:hypothetical protein D3C80_739730 [compost metagenome]
MLLNIDKPHCTATLHDETCPYVPKPHGTKHKPCGELARDGGWFAVQSHDDAKDVAQREFPQGTFRPCPYCQESIPT